MASLSNDISHRLTCLIALLVFIYGCKQTPSIEDDCPDKVPSGQYSQFQGGHLPDFTFRAYSGYGGLFDINPLAPHEIISWKSIADASGDSFLIKGIVKLNMETDVEQWIFRESRTLEAHQWGKSDWMVFRLNSRMLIQKSNGDSTRELTSRPGAYFDACWSPQGDMILCWGRDRGLFGPRRIFVFDLEGNVIAVDSSYSTFLYYGHADWNENNLIVSTNQDKPAGAERPGEDLTFLSFPDLDSVKRIRVIGVETDINARISDLHWRPGSPKVLWTAYGVLYETDFNSTETRVVYDNCKNPISQFTPHPDGSAVLFSISEHQETLSGDTIIQSYIHQIDLNDGSEDRIYTFPEI